MRRWVVEERQCTVLVALLWFVVCKRVNRTDNWQELLHNRLLQATMSLLPGVFMLVCCCAIGLSVWFNNVTKIRIPKHMLGHKSTYIDTLFDEETQGGLLDLLKSHKRIPTNGADLTFYKVVHEHIGEAQAIQQDGTCAHPFLVPNQNGTLCILPGRIDIARHYAMTGGYSGLKESLKTLFSRLQSFGLYIFDISQPQYKLLSDLFSTDTFQNAARGICPVEKQVLDPFQFNFIVQVPGQTVPTHVDGVYFWGATRFIFPQWLLAVMEFSGIFQDKFIDQVQVVGYISDWDRNQVQGASSQFGQFVYWDDHETEGVHTMPPLPRSGNAIDGSKTVHTTTLYGDRVTPPYLDKNKKNELVFSDDLNEWQLVSNSEILARYSTSDLRVSIVYRARCFRSEQERDHFSKSHTTDYMSLDHILDKLVGHAETVLGKSKAPSTSRLDLAMWLLDTYIYYPWPKDAYVPFNFCALLGDLFCS
mmetsp:Transcript_11273/g.20944  ORF Transcript_11273/g.20944 Transcript_11273/m.20944 type:complete len:476 (-) Transcript_11273:730-2157(-)